MTTEKAPVSTDTQVLSPAEVLEELKALRRGYAALAGPCRTMEAVNRQSTDPSDLERSEHQRKQAESAERVIAALEQAIALVEVLTHPRFYGIDNGAVGIMITHRLAEWKTGATPMEAILKAHAALYPSTPKTETEDKKQ